MGETQFEAFLAEKLKKVQGISYPVRAGFLRRAFIHKAACAKLYPNPDDEFCFKDIGPNYQIMSRYKQEYVRFGKDKGSIGYMQSPISEPLEVEKIHPEGYMILNGHHRWGAACQVGIKTIPVRIVDLTQGSDILKMLDASSHDRRVTLDLDEVVFRPEDDPCLEKQLPFPTRRYFRERLRLGIPALFHMLNQHGYDIWIYTSSYYSLEYLRHYFAHYRVHVTGIVTGTARKGPSGTEIRNSMKQVETRYVSTVHIDNKSVLRTVRGTPAFTEYPLSGSDENWSLDVMDAVRKMEKDEKAK